VRRWFEERRDEVPAPALVRADLVIDPYQVFETVALGGDGLVIVAAAVTRNQLEDLLGWSEELGLEALVYLCDAADADRALAARATRFAIGQGDLFDAEDRGEPGAGWLRELSRELPREAVRVSWGGVRTLADADARAAAGATALVAGRGYLAVREAMARREEG
jgi:indole-3-glycerol phosphate synthase